MAKKHTKKEMVEFLDDILTSDENFSLTRMPGSIISEAVGFEQNDVWVSRLNKTLALGLHMNGKYEYDLANYLRFVRRVKDGGLISEKPLLDALEVFETHMIYPVRRGKLPYYESPSREELLEYKKLMEITPSADMGKFVKKLISSEFFKYRWKNTEDVVWFAENISPIAKEGNVVDFTRMQVYQSAKIGFKTLLYEIMGRAGTVNKDDDVQDAIMGLKHILFEDRFLREMMGETLPKTSRVSILSAKSDMYEPEGDIVLNLYEESDAGMANLRGIIRDLIKDFAEVLHSTPIDYRDMYVGLDWRTGDHEREYNFARKFSKLLLQVRVRRQVLDIDKDEGKEASANSARRRLKI